MNYKLLICTFIILCMFNIKNITFAADESINSCLNLDHDFYVRIRQLENSLDACMRQKPKFGIVAKCSDGSEFSAWSQCNNIRLDLCKIKSQQQIESKRCRSNIKNNDANKNALNKYEDVLSFTYDKYNVLSESYDAVSNPKEFVIGALQSNYESFMANDLGTMGGSSVSVENSLYPAIYDFVKYGYSKTNDPIISLIQNVNLERISNHFDSLMSNFDSALRDLNNFDFPLEMISLTNFQNNFGVNDSTASGQNINDIEKFKSGLTSVGEKFDSRLDKSWEDIKSQLLSNSEEIYKQARNNIDYDHSNQDDADLVDNQPLNQSDSDYKDAQAKAISLDDKCSLTNECLVIDKFNGDEYSSKPFFRLRNICNKRVILRVWRKEKFMDPSSIGGKLKWVGHYAIGGENHELFPPNTPQPHGGPSEIVAPLSDSSTKIFYDIDVYWIAYVPGVNICSVLTNEASKFYIKQGLSLNLPDFLSTWDKLKTQKHDISIKSNMYEYVKGLCPDSSGRMHNILEVSGDGVSIKEHMKVFAEGGQRPHHTYEYNVWKCIEKAITGIKK